MFFDQIDSFRFGLICIDLTAMGDPATTPVKKRPLDPIEYADDFTPDDKMPQAKRYKSLSSPIGSPLQNFLVNNFMSDMSDMLVPTFGTFLAPVIMRVLFMEHPQNVGLMVFDTLERMTQEQVDELIGDYNVESSEEPEHPLDTVDRIIASVLG